MAEAPVCPNCASPLRRVVVAGRAAVARYIGVQLLFWTAVALLLAFLAAPRGDADGYAGLAALAIVVWLWLRHRTRYRYHCEHCNREFDAGA